jgi:peroxiredoxin
MLLIASVVLMAAALGCSKPDPAKEFAKLESEMEAAHDQYIDAVKKQLEQHGDATGTPDAKSAPAAAKPEPIKDPRVGVLAKMDALAEKTVGTPAGEEIVLRTFFWSAAFSLNTENLLPRFDRVARHYPSAAKIVEAVALVPEVYDQSGSPDQWIERLQRVANAAADNDAKAAANFAMGQIHLAAKQADRAKVAFEAAVIAAPTGYYADAAKGFVYEIDHLQIGMQAPDFTTTTLAGEKISLKDLRGKVVLLDFWATWCGPCLAEIPHLKAAAEQFKDRPFVILGVSLDDFREMLESTVQQRGVPGIQTWEESGRDNAVSELYHAEELPTWYLIDAAGRIVTRDALGEKLIPAVEEALRASDRETAPRSEGH